MNASNLYTRSRFGLDKRVWLVLIITSVLSLGLLAFKMAMNEPCAPINISITDNDDPSGKNYYPQDRITFAVSAAGAQDVAWDFGDNTPVVPGKSVTHTFARPGNYFVMVTVNGKCKEMTEIYVHPHIATPAMQVNTGTPDISGPEAPKAGEPVTYVATVLSLIHI